MKKKEINQVMIDEIISSYKEGLLTKNGLAKKYKMDVKRIASILKENGVENIIRKGWKGGALPQRGRVLTNDEEQSIVEEYSNGSVMTELLKKYHLGKLKLIDLLKRNGVYSPGRRKSKVTESIESGDYKINKYHQKDGFHYVAVLKDDSSVVFKDYMNTSGILTSFIKKKYGVESTLYERRCYYVSTNNYWWEQWFDIIEVEDSATKKCPYCDWTTVDVDNLSGSYSQHIIETHKIGAKEHLSVHKEDIKYFKGFKKLLERNQFFKNEDNFVVCPICNKRMERITKVHIERGHNIGYNDFKNQYPNVKVMSTNNKRKFDDARVLANLSPLRKRFSSNGEREIAAYIQSIGFDVECNRQILGGREIDMLIQEKKIGIEYNGLVWHSEWFGKKTQYYHLTKTEICNQHGYRLIHIFEDEYLNNRDLVLSKISRILGASNNLPKIMGRKTKVKVIGRDVAKDFLEKNHIQGYVGSSLYYGCFHGDMLCGVMTFTEEHSGYWNLTRFATLISHNCVGVGGKLMSYFIKENNPKEIKTFADRRWTVDSDNNLYTKLGFMIDDILPPSYWYFNKKKVRDGRFHKFGFRKKKLIKKYGFNPTMTETEMVKALGYDRVWDCGLFKYVWRR